MSNEITFGSCVLACDCRMAGRVNMVWHVSVPPLRYYRVQFPPRSPFIGDWAVYRHGELALLIEHPKLTSFDKLASMRSKFPRFQA